MKSVLLLFVNLLLLLFATITQSIVIDMTMSNVDEILKNNRVVFVNFYADWCHFSQQLKPIFAKASENFAHLPQGQVVWASVDCPQHAELGQRYMVNKYPTLKVFVNGELAHKEYRFGLV
jgi:endoplasmic reticulum resident protein 44